MDRTDPKNYASATPLTFEEDGYAFLSPNKTERTTKESLVELIRLQRDGRVRWDGRTRLQLPDLTALMSDAPEELGVTLAARRICTPEETEVVVDRNVFGGPASSREG